MDALTTATAELWGPQSFSLLDSFRHPGELQGPGDPTAEGNPDQAKATCLHRAGPEGEKALRPPEHQSSGSQEQCLRSQHRPEELAEVELTLTPNRQHIQPVKVSERKTLLMLEVRREGRRRQHRPQDVWGIYMTTESFRQFWSKSGSELEGSF